MDFLRSVVDPILFEFGTTGSEIFSEYDMVGMNSKLFFELLGILCMWCIFSLCII